MKRLGTLLAVGALALAACQDVTPPTQSVPDALEARRGGQETGFIVVFDQDVQDVEGLARQLTAAHGAAPSFVYQHALKGFAAPLTASAAAAVANHPGVSYVEEDRERHLFAQTVPTGVRRIFADGNTNIGIDGTDDTRVDVDVAIIDTGVDFEHADLNVVGGVDCSGGGPFGGSCSSGGDDDHYHGTHVGGTVAALDNGIGVVGVAPGARLWAVKVLDSRGSGYTSWIVAGIDWVAAHGGIEVANMSLGGSGFSQSEYDAIQGAVDNGVAFAVAAGNSDDDANNYSPAAFDNALTVSALADFDGEPGGLGSPTCRTDQDDTLADFSNWGNAVQIAAPGVCILSTFPIEQGEYGTISGTSMASPHAAGALALLASSSNPANATDVHNLYDQVINSGNFDWSDDSGDGIHEPLLDVSNTTLYAPTLTAGGGDDGGSDPATFSLSANAYKVKGVQHVDLTWDGATSTNVDVYRDGAVVATTANDGAYTDNIGQKGGGSYTYQVCEAGTSTCSNEATATF